MHKANGHYHQQGAALIVGLILLIVLTLLTVTAGRNTILQERMAGNFRDRVIAQQAAEATLRYVETWINQRVPQTAQFHCILAQEQCTTAEACGSLMKVIDMGGIAYNAEYNPSSWWTTYTSAHGVNPSDGTVVAALQNMVSASDLASPPYFTIEIRRCEPGKSRQTLFYRVTVYATGKNPNTIVTLESTFAKRVEIG